MPRFVRVFGAVLGVLFLTLFFYLLGFPWDLVAQRIALSASRATGLEIEMERVGPYVSFAGPGVQLRGLEVGGRDLPVIQLDRVRVRPAWSLSWLWLEPSIYVDLQGPAGHVAGAVTLGETRRFDGSLRDFALEQIPDSLLPPGLELRGRLSAVGDVSLGPDGMPEGDITVTATDGLLNQNSLPLPLKFDTLDAQVELGGDVLARIPRLHLVGPMFDADAQGEFGAAPVMTRSAVDFQAEVKVKAPLLLIMAKDMGVSLDERGAAKFSVGGTLGAPKIR